ncbi:hypothetical protein E8E12_006340 [Didymella heteroderae]|uniref:Aminotransferase class I/classII large domain-containing protein n=1 Tax=Didymella heteroderae TaxID=1769908 RepID=A0A9P4WM14_9PLEO|nr:hypothetical protein E8E12_006340 [Didymella heteroderae]
MALSHRGQANAAQLSIPWRFARAHNYDPITNPGGLISFATAENCLIQKEMHDFITKVPIPQAALRYAFSTGGGPRLPVAFANHINEYFAPHEQVRGDDVKITAAATALHDVLAYNLCAEGEGVLTSRPYYGRFEIDFVNKAGVKLVPVDTDHANCFEQGVIEAFEEQLRKSENKGVRIRAVLVVNPHNPLGKCYPKETLVELMRFCQRHTLHFISDEIYALSVFENLDFPDAVPFSSALSIDTQTVIDADLVHVIYGLSKDFGVAGLKVGCLISRNNELKSAVTTVQRFCGISGPSVSIATQMLENREWMRSITELSKTRLAEAYMLISGRLRDMGIRYMEGGNAGLFVWVDLTPWLPPTNLESEGATREQMLAQKFFDHGVHLQPGEEHGREGWFRVVFSALEKLAMDEGLRRIEQALGDVIW